MIQGFSGGLLRNTELFYLLDLPTFQRDFAQFKTLDHATGPAITFTRASNATFFDADGVLQTASSGTPRFDHDPANGESRGLLIEESRTNSIRNSQAGGSTNGVIGSNGVMPTNWSISANANGVTSEIVGTGTETGLAYIDIKVSGTPTAGASVGIFAEGVSVTAASNGQSWTASSYVKLAAGSTTNAVVAQEITGRNSAGNSVSGQAISTTITATSAALKTQRGAATVTMSSADVVSVAHAVRITYTNGSPIDLTLRIAAPQLEQGAFATSYIPTTTAAATRAADSAVVTPISSFYNQAEGTLFAEYRVGNNLANAVAADLNDNSFTRRMGLVISSGGTPLAFGRYDNPSSTTIFNISIGSVVSANTEVKMAFRYAQNDFQAARNGSLGTADTSGDVPPISQLLVGSGSGITALLNGHIRKVAYWPRRLSNSLLQQLTT
jgi:hypothetical protein